MAVESIRVGGATIVVETVPLEAADRLAGRTHDPTHDPGGELERRGDIRMTPVAVEDGIVDVAGRIETTVRAVVAPVAAAFAGFEPKEWSVELSFGFKGGAGIPFLVSGEANGAIKVSAKWTRP